jgi:hypothetical protein
MNRKLRARVSVSSKARRDVVITDICVTRAKSKRQISFESEKNEGHTKQGKTVPIQLNSFQHNGPPHGLLLR